MKSTSTTARIIAICPLLIISLSQELTGTAAPDVSLWGLIGVAIVLIHTFYYNFGFKPIPVLGMIMGINELVKDNCVIE